MSAELHTNSREYHQSVAMLCARAVRSSYSKDNKQQARRECLAHLRASLARPVAAGESAFNNCANGE